MPEVLMEDPPLSEVEELQLDTDVPLESMESDGHSLFPEDSYSNVDTDTLERMTLKELQNYARENNIKIKGRKNDLIDRIKGINV